MKKEMGHQKTGGRRRADIVSARKEAFLSAYKACGNVSTAAQEIGLGRRTVYDWNNSDKDFAERFAEIPEYHLGVAEKALFKLIKENNFPAIRFFLETKGRNRGYGRQMEISSSQNNPLVVEHRVFHSEEELQEQTGHTMESVQWIMKEAIRDNPALADKILSAINSGTLMDSRVY